LDHDAYQWIGRMHAMAERYRDQYAFAARWYGGGGVWGSNNNVDNFVTFYKATYDDAARIAKFYEIVTPEPLRRWRYQQDKSSKGQSLGWATRDFDDEAWEATDVAVDTWSALGYHDYFGRMWYRSEAVIPAAPPGRKTFLWLGATEGSVRVFINGTHVPYVDAKGNTHDEFVGFCKPVSFDVTTSFRPDEMNRIAILCERRELSEIGTGGLLSPAVIYRERP